MPFLCVPGWDIYVFSHESSETIKNIWFQSVCSVGWLFWAKKPFFLFLILIGPNHSEMVPNGKKLSDTTFGPFGTISEWFGPIWTKNGKNGFFTKSGQPTEQKSYFDWFRPFLSTPANPVQFFWLKMACTYVPDIDLYVSCWTRTSRGSLRPPKRPSKARNGQKDRFFWSRPKIVGQPDIFNCFTCFMAENINVPSSYTQNWHRKGQNIKKCHETTKITFNSYCETPCTWKLNNRTKIRIENQFEKSIPKFSKGIVQVR